MSVPIIGVMIAQVPRQGMPRQSFSKTWDIFANYAATEQMKTLVFEPSGVDRAIRTISGWEYRRLDAQRHIWHWVTRKIPPVIYDGAFLKDVQQNPRYKMIRRKLRQKHYQVFNPAFPNKYAIHKYLTSTDASRYLPITERMVTPLQTVKFIEQHQWILLKPLRGSGGKGIVEIRHVVDHDHFHVSYDPSEAKRITRSLARKELRLFLLQLFRRQHFIAQKAVPLVGTNNQKIDFRVALYRDRFGFWRSVGVICKLGEVDSPVTNFHSGGIIIPYSKVEYYQRNYHFPLPSEQRLIETAIIGANALSRKYSDLGILGIDVGVDWHGNLWMLDFNPRQGRDIMSPAQIDQALDYTVQFAKFILTSRGGRV